MIAPVLDDKLKLLESKAEYLTEMLDLTVSFNTTATHGIEDGEGYVSLLDKREVLLDKVKQIDGQLQAANVMSENAAYVKLAEEQEKRIKGIVAKFLEADKASTILAKNIRAGLTKGIKEINVGKTASKLYDELKTLNTTQFDKSN